MDFMSIAIIVVVSVSGFYFHWWLYVRIKRWVNRDLALSMATADPDMRQYMLDKLLEAERLKIAKKDLPDWLRAAAGAYSQK
ncbi:hypothetical protein DFQ45_101143 [Thiopseudomonas denitrificans]|uniref:30S ribosomal protein S3 n=2 Tax=Thiopseudomonas denitrificans TaxID=1501432 RepID=A0A4R6U242_9GAMM|nr:hypothetical protein DFQ45_101143 [Thiopseudomonas denitrificans]